MIQFYNRTGEIRRGRAKHGELTRSTPDIQIDRPLMIRLERG